MRNITETMQLIGHNDIFHVIAVNAQVNEDKLREDVDRFTRRRHIVAHRGDYDLSQNPPLENDILKKDVTDCIKVVKLVATHINSLR